MQKLAACKPGLKHHVSHNHVSVPCDSNWTLLLRALEKVPNWKKWGEKNQVWSELLFPQVMTKLSSTPWGRPRLWPWRPWMCWCARSCCRRWSRSSLRPNWRRTNCYHSRTELTARCPLASLRITSAQFKFGFCAQNFVHISKSAWKAGISPFLTQALFILSVSQARYVIELHDMQSNESYILLNSIMSKLNLIKYVFTLKCACFLGVA